MADRRDLERLLSGPNREWVSFVPVIVTSALVFSFLKLPAHGQELTSTVILRDVTERTGIEFVHVNGAKGRKYLVETMGAGVGVLDFDNDGREDVYLIQSGPHQGDQPPANALYRNIGGGRFEKVAASGLEHTGYGMGCTIGDYDNDGFVDVFVSNYGPNRLFRNNGDGTFEDRTQQAGLNGRAWSVSAAFSDVDGDGWLDLYVGNYVRFDYQNHVECGDQGYPSYCHPDVYDAAPNSFYRNNGDGTFSRATRSVGLVPQNPQASKTLGVLFFDMDRDRDADLYVANDSTANYLFENVGGGNFRDVSLLSGTAYNVNGKTEAGMGVDAADVNRNRRLDLVVTHLDFETNTLYSNQGSGLFIDATEKLGIGGPSRTRVGFGVNFEDFDNNQWVDLFVANGHVIDTIERQNPSIKHAQLNQLLLNFEGRYVDASHRIEVDDPDVSRGSAVADFDKDGDLDLIYTNNAGRARFLENLGSPGNGWIQFQLVGTHCNRDAIGARIALQTPAGSQVREVRSGSSYGSQSSLVAHFGLGSESPVSASVHWPCGREQQISDLTPGQRHRVEEIR